MDSVFGKVMLLVILDHPLSLIQVSIWARRIIISFKNKLKTKNDTFTDYKQINDTILRRHRPLTDTQYRYNTNKLKHTDCRQVDTLSSTKFQLISTYMILEKLRFKIFEDDLLTPFWDI